jgi:exosortase A
MNTVRDPIHNVFDASFEPGSTASRRAWLVAAAALAFAIAWIVFGYWRTGAAMVGIWARSDTFAHGFLVAPISAWLVWRIRASLLEVAPQPSWWVLVPLAGAGAAWLLGELGNVNAVSQLAFVAMLVLAVPAVIGTRAARRIAFPLAFLFFSVPVGEFLMPQLMEWTADFTVFALRLTGIPVYREGQNFHIPTGNWSVVEACSGVRYLIASVVIGTLFAYLTYRSTMRRIVFVGFSVLVPVIANWARAYMIVMIGHLSGNRLAVGVDHLIYGWLFFGLVILIMFWLGSRWREDAPSPVGHERSFNGAPGVAASPGEFLLVAVMVAIAAMVWPLGGRLIEKSDAASLPALSAPVSIGDWRAEENPLATWRPQFQNPPAQLRERWVRGEAEVGLYVGYYRNQSSDQKLVSSDNALVRSSDRDWIRIGGGTRSLDIVGSPVGIRTAELKGPGDERLLAWYWYWIDGRLTSSDPLAKAYTAFSRLMGRGDDSAVVIVYTRDRRTGEAEATLERFVRDAGPALGKMLDDTRARR